MWRPPQVYQLALKARHPRSATCEANFFLLQLRKGLASSPRIRVATHNTWRRRKWFASYASRTSTGAQNSLINRLRSDRTFAIFRETLIDPSEKAEAYGRSRIAWECPNWTVRS